MSMVVIILLAIVFIASSLYFFLVVILRIAKASIIIDPDDTDEGLETLGRCRTPNKTV